MSEYDAGPERVSGWSIAGVTFAASMMVLIGVFQVLNGLGAIIEDQFYVVTTNYAFDIDVTAWGWFHLLLGILMLIAGFGLFAGRAWAAVFALVLAMLSAVLNFFTIPYYPWWSLLVIALCIWVIWALTRPGAVQR
jgi:hypothetical protein